MIKTGEMPGSRINLTNKTAIVTGGANGIGAEVVRYYHTLGANVVIADLPSSQVPAEALIQSFSDTSRAIFIPANITVWHELSALFQHAESHFGQIDMVVANAGIMETQNFFDFHADDEGALLEDVVFSQVIDVNLKGTMNSTHPLPQLFRSLSLTFPIKHSALPCIT